MIVVLTTTLVNNNNYSYGSSYLMGAICAKLRTRWKRSKDDEGEKNNTILFSLFEIAFAGFFRRYVKRLWVKHKFNEKLTKIIFFIISERNRTRVDRWRTSTHL